MLTSLALVFLIGLAMAAMCQQLHLPRIIGMLLTGILLGPYVLNWLDPSILSISSDLRQMALIIILIKAGLSLNLADLKKVGRPAVMMACVPASCEILAFLLFAPAVLGITRIEAAVMGAVLGAVSPAVVIPRMVQLMEEKYGTEKSIPQLIMAGASCDDIFVIVLFSTFTGMAQGGSAHVMDFVNIPVSILLGVALGAAAGFALSRFFETAYARRHTVRNSLKVIIVLGMAFLLMAAETGLKGTMAVSGLLAVVSMACVLKARCVPAVSGRLAEKFGKLWLAAEVILFVLVGAAVDVRYTLAAGVPAAAAASAASRAAASAAAFFSAIAAARSSLILASAARRAFSADLASVASLLALASILPALASIHLLKRASASVSVNAPLATPPSRCFLYITPLYERIARQVSVGCAPFCNQSRAFPKSRSIVAGFVLGL